MRGIGDARNAALSQTRRPTRCGELGQTERTQNMYSYYREVNAITFRWEPSNSGGTGAALFSLNGAKAKAPVRVCNENALGVTYQVNNYIYI